MNIYLVIPTIRSLHFFTDWGKQFAGCHLLIVEDHPDVQIKNPAVPFLNTFHYTWKDIKKDFGKDEWIFSRKNAGIRSYGFWKAYQKGADIIITLDDDCYPTGENFVKTHVENLTLKAPTRWFPTLPHPQYMYTRGIPYTVRDQYPAVISHGLWSNKIDLDGMTEVAHPNVNLSAYPPLRMFIPAGVYFPMCSMNLAFTRGAVPFMYFPPMGFDPQGKAWGYDRFDDIWAGIFAKKICDHLGFAIVNGSPFVEHKKVSDPHINVMKEKTGIVINEHLWEAVDRVELTKTSPAECYQELANKVKFPKTPYFKMLQKAMTIWSTLF
jgi:Reversibly glycosylated polypeptide